MSQLDISPEVVDEDTLAKAAASLREAGVVLPTLSQLADPSTLPPARLAAMAKADPGAPDPANLWRVHWFNDAAGSALADVPGYLELPEALTGVKAKIIVALGNRFPMIGAHKVLAAYGCLVPRLVTGRFDPRRHKAVWPSTGNYCRGGVAISRILGCRGIAVLPAGMSKERFDWLERWTTDASDIVRTPGTESNVKEIYDRCASLAQVEGNVVLNQFSEFANYITHYHCTGPAMDRVFADMRRGAPGLRLAAFVSATGSAGTIAAGDYLKQRHGARIVAVEATQCPTMLQNGYGEHNIQGIGDKHIPLIHNVMNTDVAVGVSDRASDSLNLLFNSDVGKRYLARRQKLDAQWLDALAAIGISGWANVVAAIKVAKHFDLGADDAIVTVATDSAQMYGSERASHQERHHPHGFDEVHAGEIFARHLQGVEDDHLVELTYSQRKRIFNLGYFTWVEQQGVSVEQFDARKDQAFWLALQASAHKWDALIEAFNARTGAGL
ncbi:MAG TPA: pyridoxal-phosphate dependent enzyme [Ramlibacter sp.]|nr:pyridoxal-phosphate dependent enzyme [Ramlibacter sp.]